VGCLVVVESEDDGWLSSQAGCVVGRASSEGISPCHCVPLKSEDGVAAISRLLKIISLFCTFAKEPHKRDDILKKRPIILRSLLIVATP